MSTPFAALESRINTAALARLSNASALIDGQPVAVDGVFDAAPDPAFGGLVQDDAASFTCALDTVVAVDSSVTIRGRAYKAVSVDPDGRGMLLVRLK